MTSAFATRIQQLAERAVTEPPLRRASWPKATSRFNVNDSVFAELLSECTPYIYGSVLRSRTWMRQQDPAFGDLVQDISLHLFQLLSVHGPRPNDLLFAQGMQLRILNLLTHRRNCQISPEIAFPEDFEPADDSCKEPDMKSFLCKSCGAQLAMLTLPETCVSCGSEEIVETVSVSLPAELATLSQLILEGDFLTSQGKIKRAPLRRALRCSFDTLDRKLGKLGCLLLSEGAVA